MFPGFQNRIIDNWKWKEGRKEVSTSFYIHCLKITLMDNKLKKNGYYYDRKITGT